MTDVSRWSAAVAVLCLWTVPVAALVASVWLCRRRGINWRR